MWRGSSPDKLEPLFGVAKPNSLEFDLEPQVNTDVETQVDTDFVLTSSGDLVFRSGSLRVVDGVIQHQTRVMDAIWKDTGGFLEAIMHTGIGVDKPGSDAPGTEGTFTGNPVFTANGVGRVAFISQYEVGGVIQGRGLWAQDSQGVLQLVALEGKPLMTRDGMKEVSGLTLLTGPGNVSGFSSSYNDRYELAFRASFNDSSSGIFRASVEDVPPLTTGKDFFWSDACGDSNWAGICDGMTNWNDKDGNPLTMPPRDNSDDDVTIADALVILAVPSASSIGSLTATGSLNLLDDLTLARDSSIAGLKLFGGILTSKAKLTLSKASKWTGGTIDSSTTGTVVLTDTMDIKPGGNELDGTPLIRKIAGVNPFENRGTVTQSADVVLSTNDEIDNKAGATWKLGSV